MGSSNEMNRLVACVAFSGDLKPNASAAAVALARQGYEVALMPERYRPPVCIRSTIFWKPSSACAATRKPSRERRAG